ncbi:hypothetical protein LY56_01497 [Roseinatronobacter thiooxidans]|uniref:Uncharacterized protein n=1 Tax=Roseinatronobacter thiooxidans TaxID=121821 RepID=A0A2W7QB96_9RHOB|nr:hypothetical protein LY56_01497 [Roseinatronobacter thiooxidans]
MLMRSPSFPVKALHGNGELTVFMVGGGTKYSDIIHYRGIEAKVKFWHDRAVLLVWRHAVGRMPQEMPALWAGHWRGAVAPFARMGRGYGVLGLF